MNPRILTALLGVLLALDPAPAAEIIENADGLTAAIEQLEAKTAAWKAKQREWNDAAEIANLLAGKESGKSARLLAEKHAADLAQRQQEKEAAARTVKQLQEQQETLLKARQAAQAAQSSASSVEQSPKPTVATKQGCLTPEQALQRLEQIANTYAITFSFDTNNPAKKKHCRRWPTREALANYVTVFADEFPLYSQAFIKKTKLRHISFCAGINVIYGKNKNITTASGLALSNQIFLDTNVPSSYAHHVIHHELYHIIDAHDTDSTDWKWKTLNQSHGTFFTTFKYGDAASAEEPTPGFGTPHGFASSYATSNIYEDKAELYANLVINPKAVEQQARSDNTILSKAEMIKKEYAKFSPDLNDTFWDRANRMKRTKKCP